MKNGNQTILIPESFGAPLGGGFYGGQIRIGDGIFAVVWAPKVVGEIKGAWLPSYTSVLGATSCFDSMANTVAMAEAGSPIAKQALGLDINGHTDWCIPARDVLELGYRNLKPTAEENSCSFRAGDNASSLPAGYPYTEVSPAQTSAEAFRKGSGDDAFYPGWYWSSTQSSEGKAWNQTFYHGNQCTYGKRCEARVRLVRFIQIRQLSSS